MKREFTNELNARNRVPIPSAEIRGSVSFAATVNLLRLKLEGICELECGRYLRRLPNLSHQDCETVSRLTRAIVNHVVEEPSVRLQSLPDQTAQHGHLKNIRFLFDLPE